MLLQNTMRVHPHLMIYVSMVHWSVLQMITECFNSFSHTLVGLGYELKLYHDQLGLVPPDVHVTN